jgi:hypothetical protein
MRKRFIEHSAPGMRPAVTRWLDVGRLAQVELTSEDAGHPIESALVPDTGPGWRARQPGRQTVRLLFDNPQKIESVHIEFREEDRERTQEFTLRWSPDSGGTYHDIVRQQYHFSPPHTAREIEDYTLRLEGVTVLELDIIPDIGSDEACASIAQLRLA